MINLNAVALSSHCRKDPILATKFSPSRRYSTTIMGSSKMAINKFKGTANTFVATSCNDIFLASSISNIHFLVSAEDLDDRSRSIEVYLFTFDAVSIVYALVGGGGLS